MDGDTDIYPTSGHRKCRDSTDDKWLYMKEAGPLHRKEREWGEQGYVRWEVRHNARTL